MYCELLPSDMYNNSEELDDDKLFHHYSISVRQNVDIPKLSSYTFPHLFSVCFFVCLYFFV